MRKLLAQSFGAVIAGATGALVVWTLGGDRVDATRLMPADLGPADALVLSGKDAPLVVRNSDGRIGWSDDSTARAWSVGCVQLDPVIKAILATDRYLEERKTFEQEAQSQGETFEQRDKALRAKYPDIKADDPNFNQARDEFVALQQEFEKWRLALQQIQAKHMAEQIEKAYREMLSALEVVADRRRIDLVFRFIPADRPFEAGDVGAVMVAVQARPFLRHPQGMDLTDDIFKELGLQRPDR